ncbi:MAG: YhbY family RNA-binding protein [Angelakisella sp.]
MLTSKQRAKLRSIATTTDTILQIGKGGIGDQLITQVNDALQARELVKLHVLETAPQTGAALALQLAEAAHCEVVQVIGSRIVLYRRNTKNPVINLSDTPDKPVKPKKPAKAKRWGKIKTAGTPYRAERTERPYRSERSGSSFQADAQGDAAKRADRPNSHSKADRASGRYKAARPSKPYHTDKPGRSSYRTANSDNKRKK